MLCHNGHDLSEVAIECDHNVIREQAVFIALLLQDSFDNRLPSVIFGVIAVISGLLALVLPETLNQPMPQTLEDGEKFGQGDTAFNVCCRKRSMGHTYDVALSSHD